MKELSDSRFGDEVWPPGFRFHPTDEELVLYYLKRKICRKRLKLDIIGETDVYKWDPEELPGQSKLKTRDRLWFFFSPRDRKYPNGGRSNRATRHGYWKATGKDRNVTCNSRTVGVKKTLVFYRGRAPNGERTDWVMHEYTLDEEELKRCQNVQDYYVLYKIYKKSGPGPKNGEQYGAPFKEEEWPDDECLEVNDAVDQEIPEKQFTEFTADVRYPGRVQSQLNDNDIEEFMSRIAEECALPQPQISDHGHVVPQMVGEEETRSTLVDPSFREVIFPEPIGFFAPSDQQYDERDGFDLTQSATSKLQPYEAPEVSSAYNNCERTPYVIEEGFLEIDDLLGPEPTFSNAGKPVENLQFDEFDGLAQAEKPAENLQFDEFDGLTELDQFHDASMFLLDLGPIEQGTLSHPYMNATENNMVNQVDYQLQPHSVVNHVDYQVQPHSVVNHVDYQVQPHSVGGVLISSPLWTHDQRSNASAMVESNQGTLSLPTSGGVNDIPNESNQNQSGNEGGGTTSWFSSSMWAFVESIPTTPASASETPLMNRAFERMSSFSRVRINAINTSVAAGNGAATLRRAGRSRGFFFASIFGVLCAILWVLMGTVRGLGRCSSS